MRLELNSDRIGAEKMDDLITQFHKGTCNGFAFWYVENHENAVVKDALIEGGSVAHCYVYDRDRDVTIDVTLGQFSGKPLAGCWDGDYHPYALESEEIREWTDEKKFEDEYNNPNSDFVF